MKHTAEQIKAIAESHFADTVFLEGTQKQDTTFGFRIGYAAKETEIEQVEIVALLDYFAAKAMQGICADGHTFWDSPSLQGNGDLIADLAYRIALSMLEERQKHIK